VSTDPGPAFVDALARFVFEHSAVRGALVCLDDARFQRKQNP